MATCPILQVTVNLAECDFNPVASSYRYKLPQDVVLDTNCGYCFSLLDFNCSLQFVNNLNCDITFRNTTHNTTLTRSLQPYCCASPNDLVLSCNVLFNDNDVKQFCHSEQPPFHMEFQSSGKEPNRVKISTILPPEATIELQFNKILAIKLGMGANIFDTFPVKSMVQPHVNYNNEYMLVLVDCCQNRIYNSKLLPLCDSFCLFESARKQTSSELVYPYSTRKNSYGNAYQHVLTSSVLRYITFTLLHEDLQPVVYCNDRPENILLTFCVQRHLFI